MQVSRAAKLFKQPIRGQAKIGMVQKRHGNFHSFWEDAKNPITWKWRLHDYEKYKKFDAYKTDNMMGYRWTVPHNKDSRWQEFLAHCLGGAFWFWTSYHIYYMWGHLFAEFPWPEPEQMAVMWSDEELGIPPDDAGPAPKIEHPHREPPSNDRWVYWKPKWRKPDWRNYYGD